MASFGCLFHFVGVGEQGRGDSIFIPRHYVVFLSARALDDAAHAGDSASAFCVAG